MNPSAQTAGSGTLTPLWSLILSLFLVIATANAPTPLYPLWAAEIGYAQAVQTIIFTAYILGILAALLSCSKLVEALGAERTFSCALLVTLVADLCYVVGGYAWLLVIGRILSGLATGIAVGASPRIQRNAASRGLRHPSLLVSLTIVLSFGAGPLAAGILATAAPFPLQLIFVIAGLLLVTQIAVLEMFTAVEQYSTPDTMPKSTPSISLQLPGIPRGSRAIVAVTICCFAGPFAFVALFISLGPSLISELLHFSSPMVAGTISFLVFAAGAAAQFFAREVSVQRAGSLGLALAAVGIVAVLVAERFEMLSIFALAALLGGTGQSLSQFAALRIVSSVVKPEDIGRTNAAFFAGGYTISGISVLTLGFASDSLGSLPGTVVYALVCLAVILAAFVGLRSRTGQVRSI
jgi:MFS family permease